MLETVPLFSGRSALAIGIGVNLVEAPSLSELATGSVPPVSLQGAAGTTVTAEEFLEQNPSASYDAVVASEVIEHVDNPQQFVDSHFALTRERQREGGRERETLASAQQLSS